MTRRVEFLQLPDDFSNSFALQVRRRGKGIKRRRKKKRKKSEGQKSNIPLEERNLNNIGRQLERDVVNVEESSRN